MNIQMADTRFTSLMFALSWILLFNTASVNAQVCGNGVVQVGEECDDGNGSSGDGCSGACQCESPAWMYWASNGLERAELDGGGFESMGVAASHGVALDMPTRQVFTAVGPSLWRCDVNGHSAQIVVSGLSASRGVAVDSISQKIYWTDTTTDLIQRANFDGSNLQTLVSTGNSPRGIAVDAAGGKMYWVERGVNLVIRADLSGANVETIASTGSGPYGIVVDSAAGKVYWTESATGMVRRANLDGGNVEDVATGVASPSGIALDLVAQKMVWANFGGNTIQRADLDGSQIETLITGLGSPLGITVAPCFACGNDVLEGIEGCDDGGTVNGDGCDENCIREICGNGELQIDEECDDGNSADFDGCTAECLVEFCGDAIVNNVIEECDDGGGVNGDGCDENCIFEVCGNGIVQIDEECDDGNNEDFDGCTADCLTEFCGDTIVNNAGVEECDDGGGVNGDGCDENCIFEVCGNGVVQIDEECDDGNNEDLDGCTADCVTEYCGDAILNNAGTEECDDGNNENLDGCDENCLFEICGNDVVQVGEECDDGNNDNLDGCDENCQLELALNDDCANALEIGDGTTAFDLTFAIDSGPEEPTCAFPFGDEDLHNDLWYTYTATCTGHLFIDTCGTDELDTRVAIYEGCGECPPALAPLECNDDHASTDDSGLVCPSITSWEASLALPITADQCYTIRVGSFAVDDPTGPDELRLNCFSCGDGMVDPGEHCDDGNDMAGDGCSACTCEAGGWVYWTDRGSGEIWRADLAGQSVEAVVTGIFSPVGLALDLSAGKMYWPDRGVDIIQRADLDGGNVEVVGVDVLGPAAVALDVQAGKLYWIDSTLGMIRRADLDGSNVETLYTGDFDPSFGYYGLALDPNAGKMYWTDWEHGPIRRADLDGGNVEVLIVAMAPVDVVLDVAAGKMYWTETASDMIRRSDLDGQNIEDVVTTGLIASYGLALNPAAGTMYWTDWTVDRIRRADMDGSNIQYLSPTGLNTATAIAVVPCAFGCTTAAACADLDGNDIRDDNCMFWECIDSTCVASDIVFADMGGQFGDCQVDGTADNNDRNHALNCFANEDVDGNPQSYPCEEDSPNAFNVDAGGAFGSCAPDGVCDGNDAFAALNAFENSTACSCPLDGGPLPQFDVEPVVINTATIRLEASHKQRVRPSSLIEVDVLLDSQINDLRGYQLHLTASGGKRGCLELVDIHIAQRKDLVLGDEYVWQAMNRNSGQMVVGMDASGMPVEPGYLATFTYRASRDAAGTFMIDVLADDADATHRTFLFPTAAGQKIAIKRTMPIAITVDPVSMR